MIRIPVIHFRRLQLLGRQAVKKSSCYENIAKGLYFYAFWRKHFLKEESGGKSSEAPVFTMSIHVIAADPANTGKSR